MYQQVCSVGAGGFGLVFDDYSYKHMLMHIITFTIPHKMFMDCLLRPLVLFDFCTHTYFHPEWFGLHFCCQKL